MEFGVMIEGQENLNWGLWRRIAEQTESLGFDSLWRSDHIQTLAGAEDRELVECWTSLTYLATITRRIRFGPMVSPMTFRHPSILALQAAAVSELSGGRLVLGLGAGWSVTEHASFGIELPPMQVRMDRFEDGVALIDALLTHAPATYRGKYYSLDEATLHPAAGRKPNMPVLIGGKGEQRVLRIVARYADEWNATSLTPEQFKAKSAVLDERCAEIGRDPGKIRRSLMTGTAIGETDAEIRDHLRKIAEVFPRSGANPDETAAQHRERGWIAGRPEEIVDQMRAYQAVGLQGVMFQHLVHQESRPIELLAEKVLPALRAG